MSNPGEIGVKLVVSLVVRPEVQREAGQLVDFGDGLRITREIDQREIAAASFTGLQAKLREVRSREIRKVGFRRFVASRATRARKRTATQAKRADEVEREPFPLRPETANLRRLLAPGAFLAGRQGRSVGLQEDASKEVRRRVAGTALPVFFEEDAPPAHVQVARCLAESGRPRATDQIEQRGKKLLQSRKCFHAAGHLPLPLREPRIEKKDFPRRAVPVGEQARACSSQVPQIQRCRAGFRVHKAVKFPSFRGSGLLPATDFEP